MKALWIIPFGISLLLTPSDAWPLESETATEPASSVKSPVIVTREFLTPSRINPFQYGQFIEYLCNLVPGMWAEKLYDGSFEGLSPYKFAYLKETDFREKPWYPSGAPTGRCTRCDRKSPISGVSCLKIVAAEPVPCTGGVSQDGIAVEHGLACDFSCFLKQTGLKGPVRVVPAP